MILNKHKGELMCRELAGVNAVGGAEHVQRILLSGVKLLFMILNKHEGEFMRRT